MYIMLPELARDIAITGLSALLLSNHTEKVGLTILEAETTDISSMNIIIIRLRH